MGVAKLAVNSLEPESPTEITLNVLQSLDSLKVKDNKGRGTLHLKVGQLLVSPGLSPTVQTQTGYPYRGLGHAQ